jgi:hypothetical protein
MTRCIERRKIPGSSLLEIVKTIAFDVFLAVLVAYTGVVGYWLWWPYVPLTITPLTDKGAIKIMNPGKQVKAGDDLIYKISYEKKMQIHGVLTRKLVNTYKHDLRESITTAPIGKDNDVVPIPIPKMAEPGIYNLWWSVAYKVNPLRTVIVSAESEQFEVIANADVGRGARGYPGIQGVQGYKGEKGDRGGVSLFGKGDKGPKGDKGDPGKDGVLKK